MRKVFKIFILTVFAFHLSADTDAQQTKKNNNKNNPINYPVIKKKSFNKDSLVKGFADYTKGFKFLTDNQQEILADSFFKVINKPLYEFIKRNKEYSSIDTLYSKNIQLKDIYDKLKKISEIEFKNRDTNKLSDILENILSLADTEEKVWLYLFWTRLNINENTYFDRAFQWGNSILQNVYKINDGYQRGIAYKYLGNFFMDYKMEGSALENYYNALEEITNSKRDTISKYFQLGSIYAQLSQIFSQYITEQSINKCIDYSLRASESYRTAKNYTWASNTLMFTNSERAFLTYSIIPSDSISAENKYYNSQIVIENLNRWFGWWQKQKSKYSVITDPGAYWGAMGIGQVLSGEKYYIQALRYYLLALTYSYSIKEIGFSEINSTINNIAYTYLELGNETLANKYIDLGIEFSLKSNNQFYLHSNLINKAYILYSFKKYDSALHYVDIIEKNSTLSATLYPPYYNQLLKQAYQVKYNILDGLHKDSVARIYEINFRGFQANDLEYFSRLLEKESNSIYSWLSRSKDMINSQQVELRMRAENNIVLKESLLGEAIKLRNLAIKKSENDSIAKLNSDYTNSVIKNKNTLLARNQIELEKHTRTQDRTNFMLIIFTGSLLLLSVSLIRIIKKSRNQSKIIEQKHEQEVQFEKELKQKEVSIKEAEYARINELAKNKIHNIQNDYSVIGNLLASNEVDKLKQYNNKYESFLAIFLENWKKEKITLFDELKAFEYYSQTKKVLNANIVVEIRSAIINPQKVLFLQSIFDTLLDNSIKHAFKGKVGECKFDVQIKKEGALIECYIIDNGIPPVDNDAYLRREGSGLNTLKKRLKNFYTLSGVLLKEDFFHIEVVSNYEGTMITIKLPYEETV